MKQLLLLLLLCLTACEAYERVPAPQRKKPTPTHTIVVLTTRNCVYCDKQKVTLDKMRSELKNVSVRYLPYEDPEVQDEYPNVRSFPTLYINDRPYTGYQSRQDILEILR